MESNTAAEATEATEATKAAATKRVRTPATDDKVAPAAVDNKNDEDATDDKVAPKRVRSVDKFDVKSTQRAAINIKKLCRAVKSASSAVKSASATNVAISAATQMTYAGDRRYPNTEELIYLTNMFKCAGKAKRAAETATETANNFRDALYIQAEHAGIVPCNTCNEFFHIICKKCNHNFSASSVDSQMQMEYGLSREDVHVFCCSDCKRANNESLSSYHFTCDDCGRSVTEVPLC